MRLLAFLFLPLLFGTTKVQAEAGPLYATRNDSSFVKQWVQLDSTHMDNYLKQSAFHYQEEEIPTSWWDKMKLWLWDMLRVLFDNKETGPIIKWGLILIGAITLVYLLLRMNGMSLMRFLEKDSTTTHDVETDIENIHEIDFEHEFQTALQQADYRLAIRILYLQSLKALTDAQQIEWQPGKTNSTYIRELKQNTLKAPFSRLTRQFEFTWYGGFPVSSERFAQLQQEFTTFNSTVK